jgi:parallel beta-helix repeat protein
MSWRLPLAWSLLVALLLSAATASAAVISGTVFEDRNYGGGAGRSLAGSGGTGVQNVRVEIYNSNGTYRTAVTTNGSGVYSANGLTVGTYTVRVVNGTIASTRTGGCAAGTCVPVQTFRVESPTAPTLTSVTNRVGGENPQRVDAGSNTTSATLASLTTATTVPQSISSVQVTNGGGGFTVSGIDFGFNFDTIVNTNDGGQGSLRQWVTNANAITGEAGLAQVGQVAGRETSIFMIPNGVANAGQNAGYANQLQTTGANVGAARIALVTALPALSGANTILDGRTQTTNVRVTVAGAQTNPGGVGTGGTVGTSSIALPLFDRPEVVIAANATQISGTAANVYIAGLAVENGGISVAGNGSDVRDNLVGMNADGTVTTTYGTTYGIIVGAGTGITIAHNYVKVNNSGIRGDAPGANALVEYNEVDSITGAPGGGHTNTFDGILFIDSASNITVRYNLSKNQRGGGLEFGFGAGAVTGTVTENTLTSNGFTGAGSPSTEALNVAFYNLAAGTSMTFSNNVVSNGGGTGVVVESSTGIVITQNSIFNNGPTVGLGIDLDPRGVDPNTYTPAQGVTINDSGDGDAGPNNLLNFPVIQNAWTSGGNLTVRGWARPGSVMEFFLAAADPTGFGEGATYVFSATEGSGSDTDAASSAYGPGAINGLAQGSDTTNRFSFTIPTPGGVSPGARLTATARLGGSTSEFSGNIVVAAAPQYTLTKVSSAISDPINCTTPGNPASCNPIGSQRRIPNAIVEYQVLVSNAGGAADANSVFASDSIPTNTALRVVDIAGAGTGPLEFANGVTSSGMTYTYTSLASATADIQFSNNGGTTWTYTPVAGANGCDNAVTHVRINPKGTFAADSGTPDPSFTMRFRVCIR